MHNLSDYCLITNLNAALAAGSTVHNYPVLDMSGFDGAMFLITISTFTTASVTNAHVEMGTSSSLSTASNVTDIAGSAVNFLSTQYSADVSGIIDVYKPEYRYVRLVVDRATANASVTAPIALQYAANKLPQTYSTTRIANVVKVVGASSGSAT